MSNPIPVLCLGCLQPTVPGPRCSSCEREHQAARNRDPKRRAYADPVYRSVPLAGSCADCGATTDLTRDHVIPLADGGTNDPSNIVIRCRKHNSSKGGRFAVGK